MKKILMWVWLLPLFFGISLAIGWYDYNETRGFYLNGGPDPFFSSFGRLGLNALLGLASVAAFLSGFVFVFWKHLRMIGTCFLFCSVGFFGGCESRSVVFGSPRREVFMQVGERMMPLVNAIEAYKMDHDDYPKELNDLVPTYFKELPSTGLKAFTNYNYYVGSNAKSHYDNPWILCIPACEGMGFNQFYYFPLQNYPDSYPYERMGKWAYFHE